MEQKKYTDVEELKRDLITEIQKIKTMEQMVSFLIELCKETMRAVTGNIK